MKVIKPAPMTRDEFNAKVAELGLSRRELCKRIGVGKSAVDNYALGRAPVPLTVMLALLALEHGLHPDFPAATAA